MTNYSVHDNTDRYALDYLTTNSPDIGNTRKTQSHDVPEVLISCFVTINHKKFKSTQKCCGRGFKLEYRTFQYLNKLSQKVINQ